MLQLCKYLCIVGLLHGFFFTRLSLHCVGGNLTRGISGPQMHAEHVGKMGDKAVNKQTLASPASCTPSISAVPEKLYFT